METNDQMLKQFFGEQKKEIDDFGFTHRVMRKLPDQTDRSWIVWLMAGLGAALTLLLGIFSGFIPYLFRIMQILPQLYIVAIVFGSSLVVAMLVLIRQSKTYRWI